MVGRAGVSALTAMVALAVLGPALAPDIPSDPGLAVVVSSTVPSGVPLFAYQTCTAVLVRPNLAVTAAHCVDGAPRQIDLVVGIADLCTAPPPTAVRRRVVEVLLSPAHVAGHLESDLAGLRLAGPSAGSARPLAQLTQVWPGAAVVAWTWTQPGRDVQGCTARGVHLRVVDPGTCSAPSAGYDADASSIICAIPGREGEGTCAGDSGGPVVLDDGSAAIIGVVSAGFGCGGRSPEIYARISDAALDSLEPAQSGLP